MRTPASSRSRMDRRSFCGFVACAPFLSACGGNGRQFLTSEQTYFVRPGDGDFTSWEKAIDFITGKLDFGNQTVTLNGAGTAFDKGIAIMSPWIGGGRLVIDLGGGAIIAKGGIALLTYAVIPTLVVINNGTLGGHIGISASAPGLVYIGKGITFAQCASHHMQATAAGATITAVTSSYAISGGARAHYAGSDLGRVLANAAEVTFTADVAFGEHGFAHAHRMGLVTVGYTKFHLNGFKVTGKRFTAYENSVISSDGAGEDFLPCDQPGTLESGARYT
jgi:hypothetical protein